MSERYSKVRFSTAVIVAMLWSFADRALDRLDAGPPSIGVMAIVLVILCAAVIKFRDRIDRWAAE